MLGKLARGAILFMLAAMIAAWAVSGEKSKPAAPQDNQPAEHWYM